MKWLGPKYGVEAIHECLLFNGHYGYTKEMPHEQRLRDVIGLEIGDGTAQANMMVIAKDIIGKEYQIYESFSGCQKLKLNMEELNTLVNSRFVMVKR